jgi:glycine cleavage system H protein
MNVPANLKYTKDHEWVLVKGKEATVGITDFAQHELGDIVFIEIETVGEKLSQGDVFGTVEAVKTVSDLFMPVSGTVTSKNEGLDNAAEQVNSDPYGAGWMIKIAMEDESELNSLLDAEAYKKLIGA